MGWEWGISGGGYSYEFEGSWGEGWVGLSSDFGEYSCSTDRCHWILSLDYGNGADHWDTPLTRCFRLMLGLGVMGRGDRWGDRN